MFSLYNMSCYISVICIIQCQRQSKNLELVEDRLSKSGSGSEKITWTPTEPQWHKQTWRVSQPIYRFYRLIMTYQQAGGFQNALNGDEPVPIELPGLFDHKMQNSHLTFFSQIGLGRPAIATNQTISTGTKLIAGGATMMYLRLTAFDLTIDEQYTLEHGQSEWFERHKNWVQDPVLLHLLEINRCLEYCSHIQHSLLATGFIRREKSASISSPNQTALKIWNEQ